VADSKVELPAWPARLGLAYTIGTLVTNTDIYASMKASFLAGGFDEGSCEYLAIDNTGPTQTSAYRGLNSILDAARGELVILCHQDLMLIADGRAALDQRLAELTAFDPSWAVAGNAGGVAPGELSLRITDPHGRDQRIGGFPRRVVSLDENFLVVKRAARVGFSYDLTGFHLYGADIAMAAATMGYSAYVIDFHLEHLSPGNTRTTEFARSLATFETKWCRALRPRWVQTTCALVGVSGSSPGRLMRRLALPCVAKLAKRRAKARDKSAQADRS